MVGIPFLISSNVDNNPLFREKCVPLIQKYVRKLTRVLTTVDRLFYKPCTGALLSV